MSKEQEWHERAREAIRGTVQDAVLSRLLERSNLTTAQFETVLVDQLGADLAEKPLTREEMTHLRRTRAKVSRGAFNRTLSQARTNIAEAVNTVLLLGYCAMLESPSLAPFVEASERLRTKTDQLREAAQGDPNVYRGLVDSLLEDLERASDALRGKERDT
jgi:hypothetical protein